MKISNILRTPGLLFLTLLFIGLLLTGYKSYLDNDPTYGSNFLAAIAVCFSIVALFAVVVYKNRFSKYQNHANTAIIN